MLTSSVMNNREKYEGMTNSELDNEAASRNRNLAAWTSQRTEASEVAITGVDREQTIENLIRDDESREGASR